MKRAGHMVRMEDEKIRGKETRRSQNTRKPTATIRGLSEGKPFERQEEEKLNEKASNQERRKKIRTVVVQQRARLVQWGNKKKNMSHIQKSL